jgi:hypothetical protein
VFARRPTGLQARADPPGLQEKARRPKGLQVKARRPKGLQERQGGRRVRLGSSSGLTMGPPCSASFHAVNVATYPKWDAPHALISPSAGDVCTLGSPTRYRFTRTNPHSRTHGRRHETLSRASDRIMRAARRAGITFGDLFSKRFSRW